MSVAFPSENIEMEETGDVVYDDIDIPPPQGDGVYANSPDNTPSQPHKMQSVTTVSSDRKCSSWLPVVAVALLGLLLLAGITIGVHVFVKGKHCTEMEKESDQLQSRYNNLTEQMDQIQSSFEQLQSRYNNVTAERDELKRRLCESPGWQVFDGGCYYISTEKKSWQDSRQYCRDTQSHLITINSKEEQDFVYRVTSINQWVWFGLSDTEKEGTYKWADGTPLATPTFWSRDQPDSHHSGEDCVVFFHGSSGKSFNGWFDTECSETQLWICERLL